MSVVSLTALVRLCADKRFSSSTSNKTACESLNELVSTEFMVRSVVAVAEVVFVRFVRYNSQPFVWEVRRADKAEGIQTCSIARAVGLSLVYHTNCDGASLMLFILSQIGLG